MIVAAYTLNTQINSFAVLFSLGFLTGATTTLGIIFVPKVCMRDSIWYDSDREFNFFFQMISLYQDPEGNTIFGKSVPGSSVAGTATYNTQSVELLKARIKELESLVASLNVSKNSHEEKQVVCYVLYSVYNSWLICRIKHVDHIIIVHSSFRETVM